MSTLASGARCRSVAANRRPLAYLAMKPWSSTKSCQMAIALRPRPRPSTIKSRYGSQALAIGERPGDGGHFDGGSVDTSAVVAGFDGRGSVDTSAVVAGFETASASVDTWSVVAGFGDHAADRP